GWDGGRQEGDTVLVATMGFVIVVGEPFLVVENDGPLGLRPGAQLTGRKEVEDVARVRIDEGVGLHLRQRARHRVSMGRVRGGEGLHQQEALGAKRGQGSPKEGAFLSEAKKLKNMPQNDEIEGT